MNMNDMSNLPGNSRISKDISEETLNSVKVRTSKDKSFGERIVDDLFHIDGEDAPTYIFNKVILPGIYGVISDTVGSICDNFKHSVNALLYKRKDSPVDRVRRNRDRGHEDYGRFSRGGRDRDFDRPSYISDRADDIIDSLVFDSKGQAEEVLDYLCEIISSYDVVSVRQLCTKLKIDGDFTMSNLGWYTLKDAKIYETHERNKHGEVETKWLLDLPKPINLD